MGLSLLDKEIATLNPKLNYGTLPIVQIIQEAYRYFKETGSATGLVELAALLEDEKHGWIPRIIQDSKKGVSNRFYELIQALKIVAGANRHVDNLHAFRLTRNKMHNMPRPKEEDVEKAFRIFLNFAKWYYQTYFRLNSLSDENHYNRILKASEMLSERFEVLDILGADNHSQTYKAIDLESNDIHPIVIKRPLITSERYSEIIRNEKRSRVIFNGHPNIGGYYSSHELTPVGEVLKLEYIEGITLRSWIKKSEFDAKGMSDFLYIIGRVLDGLKYIHSKDYVHGSISPESILVSSKEGVKIVTFDYCCPLQSPLSSLERAFRKNDHFNLQGLNKRCKSMDTYALGVIMKEALSGKELPGIVTDFINKACNSNLSKCYQDAVVMSSEWEKAYQTILYKIPGTDRHVRKIGLISCTRRKKPYACTARELYSESERFVKALAYVDNPSNDYERNYVISARYGLVELDQRLAPYDCDLLEFPPGEQACWASYIAQLLCWKGIDSNCEVIVHADNLYGNLIITALNDKGIVAKQGTF